VTPKSPKEVASSVGLGDVVRPNHPPFLRQKERDATVAKRGDLDVVTEDEFQEVRGPNVYCLPLVEGVRRPELRLRATVLNSDVSMLIDTGSMISLVGRRFSEGLVDWGRASRVKLRLADGSSTEVWREGFISIGLGNLKINQKVTETSLEEAVILGMDFLEENEVILDIPSGVIRLGKWRVSYSLNSRVVLPEPLNVRSITYSNVEVERDFPGIFGSEEKKFGRTELVRHHIDTGDSSPIKQRPRRLPFHRWDLANHELEKMLSLGVIEKSSSPWCSPVVLVPKKDGETRFCIDYRALNEVTKKDSYPLPNLTEMLSNLGNARCFTTLDLRSGYWQIEMSPQDKEKTAFSIGTGLWQFTVMPFGLCNAVATFQRLMERVLKGLVPGCCMVYVDDIIVYGSDEMEGKQNLRKVLRCLKEAGLTLAENKCHFLQKEVKFLGHLVSENGTAMDPEKVKAVQDWPDLRCVKDVRSFLGLATYYRKFIKDFAGIAAPLNKLLQKDHPFEMGEAQKRAKERLVDSLVTGPILVQPNLELPFVLDTDASDEGIGCVLSQELGGVEKVIAYFSKSLSKQEKNYCTTRKEMLALVRGIKNFRYYLLGKPFIVRTDHLALKWLTSFKEPEGQVARWLEQLQEYEFEVKHRAGLSHSNADALSRRPCLADNCRNCARKEERWEVRTTNLGSDWGPAQMGDRDISAILEHMLVGTLRPEKVTMGSMSSVTWLLWKQWDRLEVISGVLFRKQSSGEIGRRQLIVPKKFRLVVIEELHAGRTAGHFGAERTFRALQERFYWPGYRRSVEVFCASCSPCLSRNHPGRASVPPLGLRVVGFPFERVAIDILGPLKVTDAGNRYALVVGDYFSKWIEAYPIPDQGASTIANTLCHEFFCRYGMPVEVHSDQGRNFESTLMKEIWELMGVKKTRTTPFRPQSDGMIERFNRTLAEVLIKRVDLRQTDWDMHLPYAMLAYRTSVHSSTGFSPAEVLLGYKLKLPIDLLMPRPADEQLCYGEFTKFHQERLQDVRDKVRWNLVEVGRKMKTRFDQTARPEVLVEGDAVWMQYSLRTKGLSPKLQARWEGPYEVRAVLNEQLVRILRKGKLITVHRLRLKKIKPLP